MQAICGGQIMEFLFRHNTVFVNIFCCNQINLSVDFRKKKRVYKVYAPGQYNQNHLCGFLSLVIKNPFFPQNLYHIDPQFLCQANDIYPSTHVYCIRVSPALEITGN